LEDPEHLQHQVPFEIRRESDFAHAARNAHEQSAQTLSQLSALSPWSRHRHREGGEQ